MLLTKYVASFDSNNPLNEYPRPQLVRESYINLNGKWDFKISNEDKLPESYETTIVVPYCVESTLSGICQTVKDEDYLYYRKKITFEKGFVKDKVLLHIDACDQITNVYVNNTLVCHHENGYLPIIVDIAPYINKKENEIVIQVKDTLDHKYPYGKQRKDRGGMWYTPVSGIWQSVWIESVKEDYIEQLTITPNIDENKVMIIVKTSAKDITLKVFDEENVIYNETSKTAIFNVDIENVKLWTPENPFLYNLVIKTKHDEVKSYFAMRKYSTNEKYFLLNNKPYFIHGLLDQGYYPEGIYTPASYEAYENDVLTMKELGFNCLRKHIKIEPMRFYYYCDKYGMLVFQDIVNNGDYSFIVDTAMPTIGLNKLAMSFKKTNNETKQIYKQSLIDTVNYLYNVPSIGYYTIFNEGWGQHDADYYYNLLKEIDNTRVLDSTSGWFKETISDVESLHVYFKKIKLKKSNKPIIVSEFGGYAYKDVDHLFDVNRAGGYRNFDNLDKFNEALYNLYIEDIVNNIKNGLAGCIYTQVSDVEEEINGLFTYDRKVLKVKKELMKEIKQKIDEAFNDEQL